GIATDTPVPADYDGDGRADIAVCRTSSMTWFMLPSSQSASPDGGLTSQPFGVPGDVLMNY
ncbi:MAG: peptidase M23, partial [Acidobacteriota bacterium]